MIVFYRFFDLLHRKGLKKEEFRKLAGLSASTMAKLAKNKSVSMTTIDKICSTLNCNIEDIMECIFPDESDSKAVNNNANHGQGG